MTWTIKRRSVLAGLLLALVATPSFALLVQPVFLDMRYSGIRSSGALRVVNDRNRPMSVEVSVSSIDLPEQGEAVFTPIEGEDFLIFPAVATIPANGTQVFRVRWIGDPGEQEGKLFALTTAELPIEEEAQGGAALQLLYAIQTIVAIGPSGTRAEIAPVAARRAVKADGTAGVIVTFENAGQLHGQVTSATVNVTVGDWSKQLRPEDVSNAVGLGIVPAGKRREMFLPLAEVPAEGDIKVTAIIPDAPLV